jgi:arylsulfatase A-like enzyme
MYRRFVLSCCVVSLLSTVGFAADTPAKKPNVLFIMADDLRPELGCYGNPHVKTPNIDALAKAGVRFDRAYVQYPLCNPSRSSMLTGRYPTTTGVLDNRTWFGAAHPDFVSLPQHFQKNGYATLRCGKIFHGGIDDADAWTEGGQKRNFEGGTSNVKPNPNQAQQSDRIVVLEGDGVKHADYRTAEQAIAYLNAHKDKPFFLACGFTKPHSAPTAPKKFFDMYDPAKIPLPPDFAATPTVPDGFPKASVPARNGDLFINREATQDEARKVIQAYWASLTWVDSLVGKLIAELDRLKLRENTIIVFWGDHGYHLGEKGKWSKHGSLFEIGTRVPLIVIAPGSPGSGKASPRIVQSIDIYPTLCELCAVAAPKGLEGHSMARLLRDPNAKWDYPAITFTGTNEKVNGIAVRTARYRYADYAGGQAMFFDEQADPHEMKNLIGDEKYAKEIQAHAEIAKRFRK